MTCCILIPLLVGLLCALLGYLLGRLLSKGSTDCKEKIANLEADLDACNKSKLSLKSQAEGINIWRDKVSKLEADLTSSNSNILALKAKGSDLTVWKDKVAKLEADLTAANENNKAKTTDLDIWKNKVANLKTDLEACNKSKLSLESDLNTSKMAPIALLPFNSDAAKAVFGKKIKQDDLKLVEGIGPKIEGLFHNFDIKTWKALSETSVAKCQEVLDSGGDRYKIHNPGTWPKQAQLAYEGKWAELLKWQDELDGGKA